jgi:predicted alpha-1,2-mannosidase
MTWFEAQLDPAPIASGGWDSPDAPVDGALSAAGTSAGLWFRFPEGTTVVDLRVALSYVDAAGAAANHAAELGDLDWTARANAGADAWREVLRRVRVRGGSDDQQKIFHTALFHAALMPRRQDDVDGRYRGLDRQVHTTDHPYYSDMSLWDTFRTLHPWYMLAWPEVQLDVNRSLARMTRDGGSLPRWPIGHGYTGGMVGTPAAQVLAESWLKGIQDFDVDTTFDAAVATSRGPVARDSRGGAEAYAAKGWIGADEGGGSVANTLEYAWSDRAIASWGAAMGREVPDVLERSHGWENLFNTDVGFFTGRCVSASAEACTEDGADDGWVWLTEENEPEKFWLDHFVEGNSWHYLWYVPYDVPAMVDVQHGGDTAAFVARLRTYWYDGVFREHDDVLPDDYYWHGNEPVMHYAFLGSLAGDPDITADAARWVMMNRYFAAPYGLDGNDDAGTLSAWYLLASTGFFPVAGTTTYAVSSPLFERTEIDRAGQAPLVIDAPATSDDARYVREVRVGGEVLAAPQVEHAALMEAGGATFMMSAVEGGWGGG